MISNQESNDLFTDLIGQRTAIAFLNCALQKEQLANAYLFSGPEGVGRKLAALRFLEGLLSGGRSNKRTRKRLTALNHPDLLWVGPTYLHQGNLVTRTQALEENINRRTPPQIRLEQVRGVSRFLCKQPVEGRLGIVIIDEVEAMAEQAANALLKTLEEPNNGLLILISSRPDRLLPTIRSRCQQIPFTRLSPKNMQKVILNSSSSNVIELAKELEVNQKELLNLANGSPGAFLKNLKSFSEIPQELFHRFKFLTTDPIEILSLARDLTEEIDIEQQIWVIQWFQQYLWNKETNDWPIKRLEKLKLHLLAFVQPRLAWEVALLALKDQS